MNYDKEIQVRKIVTGKIEGFCNNFSSRHLSELDNPEGTLNSKIHNIFVARLGDEILYYSAMVRSFDSSFGNLLEDLAIEIAKINYEVRTRVEGPLTNTQTSEIALLLENYKRNVKKPDISDYQSLRNANLDNVDFTKRHESDYYLIDKEEGSHHLIELKIGGDLDNKKARSEKEALLEQFAILCNTLENSENVYIHFATAYNRFGEGRPWKQGRVLQFFSPDELLIGSDFWNFICKSPDGYNIVLDQYNIEAPKIKKMLNEIKDSYLYK